MVVILTPIVLMVVGIPGVVISETPDLFCYLGGCTPFTRFVGRVDSWSDQKFFQERLVLYMHSLAGLRLVMSK